MSTIREILDKHVSGDVNALELELLDREDAMADTLRLAGVQFGLYPEIVAEVLAQVGLGTPVSEAHREFIRSQFMTLMNRLREEHEGHG